MVVALTALVIACGGSAMAAGVLITSSSQVGRGVITAANIRDRTITGGNIRRGSLTGDLLGKGSIGSDRLTSDASSALKSSGTTAVEFFRKAGPESVPTGNSSRVMTADNVPAGIYAIFAKTIITDLDPGAGGLAQPRPSDGHCELAAGGDLDEGRAVIGTIYGNGPSGVYTQITHTFAGPGTITLNCDAGSKWRASDSTIIAVRLGNAPRTQVTG
jgi:hypothetical protein